MENSPDQNNDMSYPGNGANPSGNWNAGASPNNETSYPGGANNQLSDWRAALPPELQPAVSKYNNMEGFVKAYMDLQGIVGKKVSDFSKQDFQAYNQIMSEASGVPVSPDAYNIDPMPLNSSESVLLEEDTAAIKEIAHALRLNNDQAQALHDAFNAVSEGLISVIQQQKQQKYEGCLQELAGAWGNAYEGKLQAVDNAMVNVLPNLLGMDAEAIRNDLGEAGVYNSPALMKTLAAIGELTSDSASRGYNHIAPMDAQTRYGHLRNDPDFMRARIDPHHPLHEQVKQEFSALCQAANE